MEVIKTMKRFNGLVMDGPLSIITFELLQIIAPHICVLQMDVMSIRPLCSLECHEAKCDILQQYKHKIKQFTLMYGLNYNLIEVMDLQLIYKCIQYAAKDPGVELPLDRNIKPHLCCICDERVCQHMANIRHTYMSSGQLAHVKVSLFKKKQYVYCPQYQHSWHHSCPQHQHSTTKSHQEDASACMCVSCCGNGEGTCS